MECPQAGASGAEPLRDLEKIARRPREAVERRDHQGVTLADLVERAPELRPVAAATGALLVEDAQAPGGREPLALVEWVLVGGGDAGVTDEHGASVALVVA